MCSSVFVSTAPILLHRACQAAPATSLAFGLTLSTAALVAEEASPSSPRALSNDAYILGVRATPEDAYRYAQGEVIQHPLGFPIRLQGGALDLYAVTDHAEYLGVLDAMGDPKNPLNSHPLAASLSEQSMRSQSIRTTPTGARA